MHKEARTERASLFKPTIFGVFILLLAGFIYFIFANSRTSSRPTSATLKVLGFGTNQSGAFVKVQLSNSGPSTITYRGNTPNQPRNTIQFRMWGAILPLSGFAPAAIEKRFELKPCRSINFEVPVIKGWEECQVTLSYSVRDSFQWLRAHTPYRISRWLPPRPQVETAATPLLKSNSLLTKAN